jgi:hypothetical protein
MTDPVDNPLASALGVILAADQAKSDIELKRTEAATIPDGQKANNDANFARETLYDMITKSNESIVELMRVAKESMSARHYEVLAQMINGNAIMADKLLKIHADHQTVQNNAINLVRNQGGATPGGNVHIDKAVFVGTTNDLLAMVRNAQQENAITVDARPVDDDE